jgi:hypothetical protein
LRQHDPGCVNAEVICVDADARRVNAGDPCDATPVACVNADDFRVNADEIRGDAEVICGRKTFK